MKLSIRHFFTFSFLLELFLFAFTLFLTVGLALNIFAKIPAEKTMVAEGAYSAWTFIFLFIVLAFYNYLIIQICIVMTRNMDKINFM